MTKWVCHSFGHDLAKSATFWEGNHLSIDPAGLWTLWKNDFGFLSECFSWKIRYPMSLMSASFAYKLHFSNKQCLFCQICIKCTIPEMALSYWPISIFKNISIVQKKSTMFFQSFQSKLIWGFHFNCKHNSPSIQFCEYIPFSWSHFVCW